MSAAGGQQSVPTKCKSPAKRLLKLLPKPGVNYYNYLSHILELLCNHTIKSHFEINLLDRLRYYV